ncbi:MAG: LysR substrate-binding domain-containing protein, partial [Betaproteobacteria bacterium]
RVRVKILDASANDVLTAVSNGEADFGINFMGAQDPGIEFKVLIEERFVAACRRDHALARLKRVTWSQLGEYEYVAVNRSSGNRLLLDQALFNASARVNSVFETKHVNTALALVEAGLGVAAVPAMAMPTRDHPLLVGIPLVEPAVSRRLGLIKRRGRELSPAAELLYNLCMKLRHSSTGRARDAAAGR